MKLISGSFNKLSRVGKIVVGVLGGLVLIFCCCPMLAVAVFPSKTTPTAVAQARVTEVTSTALPPSAAPSQPTARPTDKFTPAPPTAAPSATETRVPEPTRTARPSATVAPAIVAGIPGLSPVDVTINLEQRGFKCDGPSKPADVYLWDCSLDKGLVLYTVFVDGRTLNTVDSIQVVASQLASPTDELVAPVFGFIATMPYDNAKPQAARTWIESSLPKLGANGQNQTTTVGGVGFHLYGKPMARCLDIGDLVP